MRSIITLLTDFGEGSPYVAQMKGIILARHPHVQLVDITHSIAPQDVRQAAIVLADVAPHFPAQTIHVCVVDPGVGTGRRLLYARIANQHLLAPDNGLLSRIAHGDAHAEMREIVASHLYRKDVSATFHGRDILAPLAAHLSQGLDPVELGPVCDKIVTLSWPTIVRESGRITGGVEWIDRFGNLITNIERALLPTDVVTQQYQISCSAHADIPLVRTYGESRPQTLVALFGSNDRLEIAINNGNAMSYLQAEVGTEVTLTWIL